jgi:hypothetical protein
MSRRCLWPAGLSVSAWGRGDRLDLNVHFKKITKKGSLKMKKIFTLCVAAIALSGAAATATTKDDDDVRQFIQKLYTFSLANFELAKFDSRLNLRRHCELLKLFFTESLVKQANISSGCGLNEMGSIRYPSLNVEQLGDANAISRIPKAVFSEPRVSMDKATMGVTTGLGKTLYFLEKSVGDWRIVNVLLYERWPDEGGLCMGTFLTTPSQEQKRFEFKGCTP